MVCVTPDPLSPLVGDSLLLLSSTSSPLSMLSRIDFFQKMLRVRPCISQNKQGREDQNLSFILMDHVCCVCSREKLWPPNALFLRSRGESAKHCEDECIWARIVPLSTT